MKVRFLYFGGCPNAEPTLTLLKETLAAEVPDADLKCLEINSGEEEGRYGFLGSPTIQIDGLDIEKERRKDPPFYGCRIYRTAQGSSGVPARAMIIEAIVEAKSDSADSRGKRDGAYQSRLVHIRPKVGNKVA